MRGHNEGSIYRRTRHRKGGESSEWTVAVTFRDGRRHTRSAADYSAAKVALRVLLKERDAGRDPGQSSQSLGLFLSRWLASLDGTTRYTTRRHYALVVRHLIDGLGTVRLSDLTPEHVNAYLRTAKLDSGAPASARTKAHRREVLRCALNTVVPLVLPYNAAEKSRPPKVEDATERALTPEQVGTLLRATARDREFAIWAVGCFTGQRESEVAGLTWPDVDFDAGTLNFTMRLARQDGRWYRVPVKSRGSKHLLPVPALVVAALRAWRETQTAERLAMGGPEGYDGYVFTTTRGRPWHDGHLLEKWAAALKRAGLPYVTFHDLRRTATLLLREAGGDIEDARVLLGHTRIATTSRSYSPRLSARQRRLSDQMEASIASARTHPGGSGQQNGQQNGAG